MNYTNLLILLFLIIIIIYLSYSHLIDLVEKKLNNIKISTPNVNVDIPKDILDKIPKKLLNDLTSEETTKYVVETKKYNNQTGETIDNPKLDNSLKENSDFILEGFDQYENINKNYNEHKKSSHVCYSKDRSSNCNLGVMNYPDPKDLNEMDYNLFKINYPPNMTMQDYVNWLYCYEKDEEQLPYNHLKNLYKLKKNIPLEEIKGICPPPAYENSPLESNKYFDKLYNVNHEFKINNNLNSQTGPIMAYNSEEYSDFSQNFDVQGISSYNRNCETGKKKSVKEIQNYLDSKDSNHLEDSDKYKKYYKKDIEI